MDQGWNGVNQEKELCSPLYHSVVATEKGAFRLPSTTVTNNL